VKRIAVALLLVATACSGSATTGGGPKGEILVFAAASLTESFTAIGSVFERAHPGAHIRFNFGPSDGLAAGITEGGGADVFASASADPMEAVARSPGVLDRALFARNRLVVIVPRDNPAHIGSLSDITRAGLKLAIAAPGVPAGTYTRQMLEKAKLTLHSAPSNEVDDKSVVQKVVLGEVDAGVVYTTDVSPSVSSAVTIIVIPDVVNVLASYPIAVVAGSKNVSLARSFVAYVLDGGRAILRAAGFLSPT